MNNPIKPKRKTASGREGTTYLEVQVAMVMLAIGVTGLYSMSVVQSRQTARLTEFIEDGVDQAVNPAVSTWAQKLGSYAEVEAMDDPGDVPRGRPAVMPRVQVVASRDDASSFGAFKSNSGDPTAWSIETSVDAYQGTYHRQATPDSYQWVQFYINGLTPGRYEVFMTYPPTADAEQNAMYWVYADKGWEDPLVIDQRSLISDLVHDGQDWQKLGVFNTDTTALWIHTASAPGGGDFFIADAVLVRNAETMEVITMAETTSGGYTVLLGDTP